MQIIFVLFCYSQALNNYATKYMGYLFSETSACVVVAYEYLREKSIVHKIVRCTGLSFDAW